ncbi:MAG: rubrerythrin [Methanobacteriaceae archaeon]|nr:rubrerythrin [Methanobacteriaceae archaeon]
MMSKIPIDLDQVKQENIDLEILRVAMIAELDAVSLYEQLAAMTTNQNIKAILLDIAREEKTHVGEFQTMLLELDEEQVNELIKGRDEVKELLEK